MNQNGMEAMREGSTGTRDTSFGEGLQLDYPYLPPSIIVTWMAGVSTVSCRHPVPIAEPGANAATFPHPGGLLSVYFAFCLSRPPFCKSSSATRRDRASWAVAMVGDMCFVLP